MSAANLERLQSLFLDATAIPEPQRESWVQDKCGGNAQLLKELQSLLSFDRGDKESVWEQPIADLIPDVSGLLSQYQSADHHDFPTCFDKTREWKGTGPIDDSQTASSSDRLMKRFAYSQLRSSRFDLERDINGVLGGKYELLDLLDTGGMGIVFKAIHRPMNRVVALKLRARRNGSSVMQKQRFQREVQVAATLENVNIVRAYDAYHDDHLDFLVMEYVNGENLRTLVGQHGPLPILQALDCILQAARGLSYAHDHGVIHRDIKPSNLMLTQDGVLKILDVGLASMDGWIGSVERTRHDHVPPVGSVSNDAPLTCDGDLLGTAKFMSPEQSRNPNRADIRSDIYSLGCTLYYLLVGASPFPADSNVDAIERHRVDPIPSLSHGRKDVPPEIEVIFRKMLAKDPDLRYQSMNEVISALTQWEMKFGDSRFGATKAKTLSLKIGSTSKGAIRGLEILMAFLVGLYGSSLHSAKQERPQQRTDSKAQQTVAVSARVPQNEIAGSKKRIEPTTISTSEPNLVVADSSYVAQPKLPNMDKRSTIRRPMLIDSWRGKSLNLNQHHPMK